MSTSTTGTHPVVATPRFEPMLTSSQALPPPVLVTGTGTDVGKTLVAALLCRAWRADYWKPVQTGVRPECRDTSRERDANFIRRYSPRSRIFPELHIFTDPVSPHLAAARKGVSLDVTNLAAKCPRVRNLVIEGAGGLLTPLDFSSLKPVTFADLISALGASAILVASNALGTLNHTLLTLEALERRAIKPLILVLIGNQRLDHAEFFRRFAPETIVLEIPVVDACNEGWMNQQAEQFINLQPTSWQQRDAPLRNLRTERF